MNRQDVILKIQREPLFCLGFAIDNNPDGVSQSMTAAGYQNDGTRKGMYDILLGLLKSGHKKTVISIISRVGYVNAAPNYTGGYSDFFIRSSPPDSKPKTPEANGSKFSWDGLLAGLGSGLSTFVGMGGIEGSTGVTDLNFGSGAPKDKDYPECAAGDTECIDKEKNKKMWTIIAIAAGAVILIVVLGVIISKSRKAKAKETQTQTTN